MKIPVHNLSAVMRWLEDHVCERSGPSVTSDIGNHTHIWYAQDGSWWVGSQGIRGDGEVWCRDSRHETYIATRWS